MDMNAGINPLLAFFACVSGLVTILDIPPLVWHFKQRNFAAASLVSWFILLNLLSVINAIIWPSSSVAHSFSGVGLCDVEVKLLVASWNAVASTLAVIMRSLARVMDQDNVVPCPTRAQKYREFAIEVVLCWVIPFVLSAVHFIVQENRFVVDPGVGCNVSVDESWPTIVLVFIWPAIFATAAGYYAAILLVRLRRYRRDFESIVSAHRTTRDRFNRLWQISLICILWVLPQGIYQVINNAWISYHPFSWSLVHDSTTWNAAVYHDGAAITITFDRWTRVGAGILIFMFFGMGRDAMDMYRRWLVRAGLGRFFPSLLQQRNFSSTTTSTKATCSPVSTMGHAWTKAKSAFTKHHRPYPRSDSAAPLAHGSVASSTLDAPLSAKSALSDTTTESGSVRRSPTSPQSIYLRDLRTPPPAIVLQQAPQQHGVPYDGVITKSITASASGQPPSRSSTPGSHLDSIRVTKDLWQEVEAVPR